MFEKKGEKLSLAVVHLSFARGCLVQRPILSFFFPLHCHCATTHTYTTHKCVYLCLFKIPSVCFFVHVDEFGRCTNCKVGRPLPITILSFLLLYPTRQTRASKKKDENVKKEKKKKKKKKKKMSRGIPNAL